MKCIWKILLLAVVFRNSIQHMLHRCIPDFRRNIQYLFEIGHSTLVILFNGITTSPANKALLVVRVQCQSARIKRNRVVDPSFDFGNLAQIEIRVITILVTIGRVNFDDCLKCTNSANPMLNSVEF